MSISEYEDFPKKNPFWNGGGKVKQADVTMLYFLWIDLCLMLHFVTISRSTNFHDPEGPAMTLSVSVVLCFDSVMSIEQHVTFELYT